MTGFSKHTRELVFLRAGGRCERCGRPPASWRAAFQWHHRRPRGMGGSKAADTNTAANCALLCGYCHAHVEKEREASLWGGWLVRRGENPAETPLHLNGRWVFLDDFGYVTPVEESA